MQPIVCPIDGKDDAIQKVSAVVASGSGTAPFRNYEGYTTYRDVQSDLARLLSPPSEPVKPTVSNSIDILWWIFLGLLSLMYIGIPFLIYALVKASRIKAERETLYPGQLSEWKKAYQKWNRAYYCLKHDIVFDPETGDSAPPQQLKEFLGYPSQPATVLT